MMEPSTWPLYSYSSALATLATSDLMKTPNSLLAIKGIRKDGEWIDNPDDVITIFKENFQNRFQQLGGSPPSFDVDMLHHLSNDQCEFLERNFSREEIKRAVWDCGGYRAPGPDGFTFKIFTSFWDLLEPDVTGFVQDFFITGTSFKGCNSSTCRSSFSPWCGILSLVKSLISKGIDLLSLCSSILRRNPRGGIESSQFLDLKILIGNVELSSQHDSWQWTLDISKGFSVASVRSLINSYTLDVGSLATRWNRRSRVAIGHDYDGVVGVEGDDGDGRRWCDLERD
uniref:RNA-directed DNA polymerase, eukaryota, reverse transcriptase zinc-binding domain protein n=1 Tax=Tanacetum cinerariifolium TaxID=118510 RepID=A0A699H4D4_TANCI|nr:RNA-directed DNA polymerase, eukaryota, reverse transcriptase zinc-binding domain protein [Tanacetum cinerariifolium]